jgi:ribose transport system substrate-binding protein
MKVTTQGRASSSGATRRLATSITLFAVAVFAAACGASDSAGAGNGSAGGDEGLAGKTVELVAPVSPTTKAVYDGIVDGLKAEGVDVTARLHPFELPQNLKEFDAAVADKPDLIILVPLDAKAIAPGAARAKAAKIPVVMAQTPLPDNDSADLFTGNVSPDDIAAGDKVTEALLAGLKEAGHTSGNLLVVDGGNTSSSLIRFAEVKKALEAQSDFTVVSTVSNPAYDAPGTQKLVQPIFAQYKSKGGIVGAVTYNGSMSQGIIQAAEQANVPLGVKNKGLIVADTVCTPVNLPQIQDGTQYSSIAFPTANSAKDVVSYVSDLLSGKDVPREAPIAAGDILTGANIADKADLCQ